MKMFCLFAEIAVSCLFVAAVVIEVLDIRLFSWQRASRQEMSWAVAAVTVFPELQLKFMGMLADGTFTHGEYVEMYKACKELTRRELEANP